MNRDALRADLIRDEGFKTDLYVDSVGKLSIGVGRNLTDRGISKAEAELMLENDIDMVFAELDYQIPWWMDLPADVRRGLANMCFNLGWPRLSGFKKMLEALKKDDYTTAAIEALNSKWAQQVGIRAGHVADLIRNG